MTLATTKKLLIALLLIAGGAVGVYTGYDLAWFFIGMGAYELISI